MKQQIKVLAIIFALAIQGINMRAATTSTYPVDLHYKPNKIDGTPKPSKAPAHYVIPLNVFYDEDTQQLLVNALAAGEYIYYVLDENNNIISQGVLNCRNNGSYSITLNPFQNGIFTVCFVYNGHAFYGTIEND